MKPGLAALLSPATVKNFLRNAWPTEPFVTHGPSSRLKGLADVPELASVESLAALPCRALLAQSQRLDQQRFGNIEVPAAVAPALLRAGVTLYFCEPELPSRSLWRWVEAIERDLGIAAGTIRPSVFCSPQGHGARMHFDATESFVVQVKGRKVWTIARNEAIAFPPVNYLEGEPLPEELASLAEGPLHAPKQRQRVVLEPGSVMYLPRGWWHSTETLEPSVHVDLLTALPTWADAMRPLVDSIFNEHRHWRTPMVAWEYAEAMGERLITDLSDAIAAWKQPAKPRRAAARRATGAASRAPRGRSAGRRSRASRAPPGEK